MKFSADSLDFFAGNGIGASNRLKGVVLHDILSHVKSPDDLHDAVQSAVAAGDMTEAEASEAEKMLAERLAQVEDRGWFPEDGAGVLNETSLVHTDGRIYRPDRVVVNGGKVVIIDYKFGEPDADYERQLRKYADIWGKMGYENVTSYLWYVPSGDIVLVQQS